MSNFTIDFFELSFLAEACIPPVPIARYTFWIDMIDKHYHKMTLNERLRIFEWMNRNIYFQEQYQKKQEDVVLFYDRYNPENQYLIHFDLGRGKDKGTVECFKNGDAYRTSKKPTINQDFITKIEILKTHETNPKNI